MTRTALKTLPVGVLTVVTIGVLMAHMDVAYRLRGGLPFGASNLLLAARNVGWSFIGSSRPTSPIRQSPGATFHSARTRCPDSRSGMNRPASIPFAMTVAVSCR